MEISRPAVWWEDELGRLKNKVAAAGSKVCPVCSTFTATTTTAINAHMDACLAVDHPKPTSRKRGRPPMKKRSMAELMAASPPVVSIVNEHLKINQDAEPEKDIDMIPQRECCASVKEAVEKTESLTEPIKEQVELEELHTYNSSGVLLRSVPLKRRKKYKVLDSFTSYKPERRLHLLLKRKQFLRAHRTRLLAKILLLKKPLVSRRKSRLLSMLKLSVDNCREKSHETEKNERVLIADKFDTLQQIIRQASPSSEILQIQPTDEVVHDEILYISPPLEGGVDSNQVCPTANGGIIQCEHPSQGSQMEKVPYSVEANDPTIPESSCAVQPIEVSSTETMSHSWAIYRPEPRRFLAGGVDVPPGNHCFHESSQYPSNEPSKNSCIFNFQPCAVYDERQMNEGWTGLPLNSQGEVLYSFYPVMTRINCLRENQYESRLIACSSANNRIHQSSFIDINEDSQYYDGQTVYGLINLGTRENSKQHVELNSDVHANNGIDVVQNRLPARDNEMQNATLGNQEQTVRLMGMNLTVNHCNEENLSRDERTTTENCLPRVNSLENSMSRHCLQEAADRLKLAGVKFLGTGSYTTTSTAVPICLEPNYVARGNFSSQNQEFSHQWAMNNSQGHDFQENSTRRIDSQESPVLRSQYGDHWEAIGKQFEYAQPVTSKNLRKRLMDSTEQIEETNFGCLSPPLSPSRASTPSLPVQSPYWPAHGVRRSISNTWRTMSNIIAKNSRSVSYRNFDTRKGPKLAEKPDEMACSSMESNPFSRIDLNVDFKISNAEKMIQQDEDQKYL